MAVASNPMKEAKAKASAMPAEPVNPPAKTWLGAKDWVNPRPSGPPPRTSTAIAKVASEASSQIISTPSTFAPTSTLSSDSPVTRTQAMSTQTYQGRSMPSWEFICPASSPPKKPNTASWMAM